MAARLAALVVLAAAGSATGQDDACGSPVVRFDFEESDINSNGMMRNRGTDSDVQARCIYCRDSFVDGPLPGSTALLWARGGRERLDLTPANQNNYPRNALTIAFWIRIQGDQPRESAVVDIDWSASTNWAERAGYTVMFNRNGETPRRLYFIVGRCDGEQEPSDPEYAVEASRDLEVNTWTQVIVTRSGAEVNIYFNNENAYGSAPRGMCGGAIATDNAGFEDHSVSIGHFARRMHGFGINDNNQIERSCRLQQAEVSLFRLYTSVVSESVRARLAEGSCRTTTTTVTSTTSTHTILQGLHRRLSRIETNTSVEIAEALNLTEIRIDRNDGRVEQLQLQMAQVLGQLSTVTEALRLSQGENRINTATIAQLTGRVDGLLAVLNSTAANAGRAPTSTCDSSGSAVAPSIQAVGDDIKVRACGGAVEFSSSSCTVDPCRTQRDLDDIKARVGLL